MDAASQPMTCWEHTTVVVLGIEMVAGDWPANTLQPRLNALGRQGWELVGVCAHNGRNGQTEKIIATLKRPVK